jgi:hypothetical protein
VTAVKKENWPLFQELLPDAGTSEELFAAIADNEFPQPINILARSRFCSRREGPRKRTILHHVAMMGQSRLVQELQKTLSKQKWIALLRASDSNGLTAKDTAEKILGLWDVSNIHEIKSQYHWDLLWDDQDSCSAWIRDLNFTYKLLESGA